MVSDRSNKVVPSCDAVKRVTADRDIEEAGEEVQSEHQKSGELGQQGDALNHQPAAAESDVDTDLTLALPHKKRSRPDIGRWCSGSLAFVVDEERAPAVVIPQAAPQPISAAPVVGGAQQVDHADAVCGPEGERQLWACADCHRTFTGLKAFFGHQRVHPGRPYRGAYPPPTFDPEGSPEPVAEQFPDLPVLQEQQQLPNVEELDEAEPEYGAGAGAREDGSSSKGRKRRIVLNEDDSEDEEGAC